jgi:putative heme-binding domain-containing protein
VKIEQAADFAAGTQRFVEIVQRFGLASRRDDVLKLAAAEGTTEQLASFAAGAVVESGSREAVVAAIAVASTGWADVKAAANGVLRMPKAKGGEKLPPIGAKLSRPALYEAILAPSAAISHNYETWTAILDDGRSFTGLLVSQSQEEVVIRGADGIDTTVAAGEVEELVKQPVSLMPANLAVTLSAQELVDLVAWLETLRQTN